MSASGQVFSLLIGHWFGCVRWLHFTCVVQARSIFKFSRCKTLLQAITILFCLLGRRMPLLRHSSTRRSASPADKFWPTLLRLFSTSNSKLHWLRPAQALSLVDNSFRILIVSTQLCTWLALAYFVVVVNLICVQSLIFFSWITI